MGNWINAGHGLEAKITNKGQVLFRDRGQQTEYPHFTVDLDSQGNIIDFHSSDSRKGNRFGLNEVITAAIASLKGKGLL